ncbi:flagellar hook-length control protein FliK [Campylobacter insulaenigrae]|uniref:flagellar hook-length control protein FliK n=1 Tax=Campylobacter insulaenigrae TaxID=260714 RepID=UPI00215384F5|nr:flagellar hook-length control protein FliK [Campylobacter insulaenigrae]MCR6571122.1 flagellar hook-length control protein FliK [Campylobacter insulaenigrae]MCR6586650.1 flagellar hook-length control protein FliK [Campylobacter insulaenigrae]MCR6587922.1 flagellar hook-length control protein FliK [Campylobacter insulaenigrae]
MSNIHTGEALNILSLSPKNKNTSKDTESNDKEGFLESLIQAIDGKDLNNYKTSNSKKSHINKNSTSSSENKMLDEKDATKLFENANFMQILSLLEMLQSNSKDIKLNKLIKNNTAILNVEKNIHKLKNIKNINELLNIAKDLGLNVKNIKFEQIQDLKKSFPNLDKKSFFDIKNTSKTSVFQDLINQKISNLLKEESKQKKPAVKNKDNDSASLLASALKNIDLSKKTTKVDNNENDKKITSKEHIDNKILINEKDKLIDTNNILKSNKDLNDGKKLNDIEVINMTHNSSIKKELEQSKEKSNSITINNLENFEKKVGFVLENSKSENLKNAKKESIGLKNQNIQENKTNFENPLNIQNTTIKNQKNEQNTNIVSDIFTSTKEVAKETNETPQDNLNSFVREMNRASNHFVKNQGVHIKETFNDFAQEFKEKVESYKAPVTRFNITLNPNNLGEVEVTLIQRGSNLNISFNSNQNTLNLFIQHQAEFKNSLVNMGFTNLEMNFSDQGKKDQNNQQKHKKNDDREKNKVNFENEIQEKPSLKMVLAKYF